MKATKKEKEDALWDEKFKALLKYKAEHGDCNVPKRYKQNPKLGSWVYEQRRNHRNKTMSPDRIRKLEEIPFVWKASTDDAAAAQKNEYNQKWNDMFEQLKVFRVENGHCNVARKYKQNPKLGDWVSTQRQYYRKEKMSQDRIEKLEEIGFDWKPARGGAAVAAAKSLKNVSTSLEGISQSALRMPPPPPPPPPQLNELEISLETAIRERDAARDVMKSIETEKESISTSLQLTEDKLSTLTNENASLKSDIGKWEHIFNELEEKYKHLNRERDELKERLDVAIKMECHAMVCMNICIVLL